MTKIPTAIKASSGDIAKALKMPVTGAITIPAKTIINAASIRMVRSIGGMIEQICTHPLFSKAGILTQS